MVHGGSAISISSFADGALREHRLQDTDVRNRRAEVPVE
jgi:hypothetical protein